MHRRGSILGWLAVAGCLFSGCGAGRQGDLGTSASPYVWLLARAAEQDRQLSLAEAIAAHIGSESGIVLQPRVVEGYTTSVDLMCRGEAHLAALSAFSYLEARTRGCAEVALVATAFGSTFYSGQVVVGADTGILGLADLAGASFCRVDPHSASGWQVPGIAMRAVGVDPGRDLGEVVDVGGHDAVIRAVYSGQCQAGATWVDARTLLEDELRDVKERVLVIAETAPIPNETLCFSPTLPARDRERITEAFLDIESTEEGSALLAHSTQWQGWERVSDSFYDGLRRQIEAANMGVEDVVR